MEPLDFVNDPLTIYALSLIILQNRDEWYTAGRHAVSLEDLGRNRRVWSASVQNFHTIDPDAVIAWVAEKHLRYIEGVVR